VLKGSKMFRECKLRSYAVENPISDPRCVAERIALHGRQRMDSLIVVTLEVRGYGLVK
jgi:hypothetical protein